MYGAGCRGILQEENKGGGGDNNGNYMDGMDSTDGAGIGDLPPPGGIYQSARAGGGN